MKNHQLLKLIVNLSLQSFTFNKHKTKVTKKKPEKTPFLTVRKSILLGLNKFGKKSLRYTDMLPLNSLWLGYMHHMLGMEDFSKLPTNSTNAHWENVSQRLMKADYHGARLTVVRSKCPSIVGVEGIIIQDTKNTFRLLSKDNVIRSKLVDICLRFTMKLIIFHYVSAIPKESCVFSIHLENSANIEIFGKELCIRPAERSVKKFKNLHIPKLQPKTVRIFHETDFISHYVYRHSAHPLYIQEQKTTKRFPCSLSPPFLSRYYPFNAHTQSHLMLFFFFVTFLYFFSPYFR